MPNPYPKTLIDDASGIEFANDRHTDWQEGATASIGLITKMFCDWANELIADYEAYPATILVYKRLKLARAEMLYIAKDKLTRLQKEIIGG